VISGARLGDLATKAGIDQASIVVAELGTPAAFRWIASFEDARPLYPASMIKLPIALALAAACAAGRERLDRQVTVAAANLTANDAASPFVAGYVATLADAAAAMLSASDNVATNVLIDALGRESITGTCLALGLQATAVRRKLSGSLPLIEDPQANGRNVHPARDAAEALRLVARDAAGSSRWIYDALAAQVWNDKLSPGWNPGDHFAHKTGETDAVSHDGGILTLPGGRRFVVVVYSALPATPDAAKRFKMLARALRPSLD